MGTRMRHLIASCVIAALFLAASAGAEPPDTPPATGTKAGNITALLPTANIVRGPAKQVVTNVAKKGDEVIWNDVVRTDKGGRARITLMDQSILSVGSQAELRIIKHDAKSQQTSIEVGYGRVRMEVTPVTQPGGSFEVKTPTAVAGVIGTTFGVDSSIGSTTILCISGGTVMVGSNAPGQGGQVPCPPGTVAVVAAGKGAVTRPATQQELQQFTAATETAVIGSMAPDSLAPGSVTDVTITGTQLGGISQVSSSNPAVTVALNPGGTATSVSVHVTIAANAAPGPATITLAKPDGAPSAAVFTIVPAGQAAQQGPSIKTLSTTMSPTTGGVVVTITGANFDANTQVKFGSVAASNVTFVSSTQLNVTVPAENAGTVDITVTNGGGTTTLSGSFMFGGPVPAISPAGVSVNPGVPVTLDGGGSTDTLAGAAVSFSWSLCNPASLKTTPSAGTVLSAASAPTCTPAAGTAVGTDSQFSFNAPATPGQYVVRLQLTDNLGASAVMFASVTVNPPNYLTDPVACTLLFAQVFATLQSGSAGGGCGSAGASTVLGFFDPTYSGLTALQQALQTVFPTYASMQVHLVGPQGSTSGNLSTVTADWELIYTLKNDPACLNISPCQPPTYHASLGTVTTVWTLTPGQGLFVTNFRYPNGFPQGTPPAVPVPIVSSAPSALAFTSPAQTLPSGVCSAALTLQSQLSSGTPANVGSTEVLTPSGPAGTSFYTDSGCTTAVTSGSLTIPTGSNTANFYMKASVAGSPGITVTGSGAFTATATQPETVTPSKLVFTSTAQTLNAGVCSAALTVQSQDSVGNPSNVGTTETLAPSGPAGTTFYVDSLCTTAVTASNLTIAVGANSASFYMKDTTAGSPQITVTGTGAFTATGANAATQTEAVNAGTIIIASSQGNTTSANAVELNGPLTDALTLTATRSDSITTGSVTLTFTGSTIASTPSQLNSIPYATPEPVDFAATIDASGNVTTGSASVTVTPSNVVPAIGLQPSTLFFNIGDVNLSATPSCLVLTGGQTPAFTFTINAVSGFNIPSVNWQWSGFPAGISVSQGGVNGTATLSGATGTYTLPNFAITSSITGTQTLDFDVTISNAQGSATKVFALNINLSTGACPAVGRAGAAQFVTGAWTRGGFGGGGMARVAPAATGPLPDLQLNAASVSFTPSIPKSGDTVGVRFRVTNAGKADAQHVPIALVVNGAVVASDTFDLRAGASTLAALEWANANLATRSPQAAVVVDPNHTVPQASTLGKSAPLAHFAFLRVPGTQSVAQTAAAGQRATLEIADGGCAGFSFASGAGAACGSADLEITVEQLASGHFTLRAPTGIADLGTAFGGGKLAGVQYQSEVPAVAGHSYAVQLGGGKTGILRLTAIRNPAQTSAKGRQVFGAGNVARNVGAATTGPVETGDVSGVRPSNQPRAYFEVSSQTQ